jgi:drug/metabolite transporter (DMT)-like permease
VRVLASTLLALVAFAGNSVLCRTALGEGVIDAASFSSIRLLSGALTLWVLMTLRLERTESAGSWLGAAWLFLYAVPFSFAYETLATGTGALILFGTVQATMQIAAVVSGERPGWLHWVGLLIALGGLVYLVAPGVAAPDLLGSILMAVAGVGWGLYSLRGRRATDPLAETAGNFVRSVPMVVLVSLVSVGSTHVEPSGAMLALTSGVFASGIGYAVWYTALPSLPATTAATVQLCVPVLAAVGGVLVMAETITMRLVVASVLILGGVTTTLVRR